MYPTNQPEMPQQPDPTEYLTEISKEEKPPREKFFQMDRRFMIIGGLLVLIIIIAIIAVAGSGGRSFPNAEVLGLRLNNLSTLIKYGEGGGVITDLRTKRFVAELSLVQANEKHQLTTVFGSDDDFSKPSDQAKIQESISDITEELDESKKAGSINDVFKRVIVDKVESVISLLHQTLPTVTQQSNQTIVQNSINNYQTVLDRFN